MVTAATIRGESPHQLRGGPPNKPPPLPRDCVRCGRPVRGFVCTGCDRMVTDCECPGGEATAGSEVLREYAHDIPNG